MQKACTIVVVHFCGCCGMLFTAALVQLCLQTHGLMRWQLAMVLVSTLPPSGQLCHVLTGLLIVQQPAVETLECAAGIHGCCLVHGLCLRVCASAPVDTCSSA